MQNYLTVYGLSKDPIIKMFLKIRESRLSDLAGEEMLVPDFISGLVSFAGKYGFYGNIWQAYLVNAIVNDENSYSLSCERKGEVPGTINDLAMIDFDMMRDWFNFEFIEISRYFKGISFLLNYEGNAEEGKVYNKSVRDDIEKLVSDIAATRTSAQMKDIVTSFYKAYGVGDLGLHKCFRIREKENGISIEPIMNVANVSFDDIIGYDIQKQKLKENTDAFVEGREANNCLLFGDSGTGKSTSIKAVANEYFEKGIRIIEVYKHQFRFLNDVMAYVKKRNYSFILYMDDLSFEEFETEYKYLKAVIEGGMEKKPSNILIYATSNRRHLIKESFADKESSNGDVHKSDTVQEKLSLSYRFGVTIYFGSPSKKEFNVIVTELAKRKDLNISEEELIAKANAWELSHGGLSGRTAAQFTDYLKGTICE